MITGLAAAICKVESAVFLGLGLAKLPALLLVAGLAVTPITIASTAVGALCFLQKHPGKPVTSAQAELWDRLLRQGNMR